MAKGELLDVTDIRSIRSFTDVFSYTALSKWFRSIPDESRQTPSRARVVDPQYLNHYRVKCVDGYMRSTFGLYFTALNSSSLERVNILARQNQRSEPYTDHDLLSTKPLSWKRNGPGELALIPVGVTLGRLYEPPIIRVESDGPLEPSSAEAAIMDIARLLNADPVNSPLQ